MSKKNPKFRFYTNGTKTIRVYDEKDIPEGYYLGRHFAYTVWNKGLKASTDDRVKNNVEKSHTTRNKTYHPAWNKGLTKETDSRIQSNKGELNPMFGKHRVAWNKGLTKNTDKSMKQASEHHKGATAWNKGISTGFHWTTESLEKRSKTIKENRQKSGKYYISKDEQLYKKFLLTQYTEKDIIVQYFDPIRYPFNCDFYIIPEDKFIEINGTWTHGERPFDPNNKECQEKLALWKEKAKSSKYYEVAIYTWTILDVKKATIAKKNNLNFEVIYPPYNFT